VRKGAKAPESARKIHSDIERGFIRAEVTPFPELVEAGSFASARTKGTLRLEGREYTVLDGDVIYFRFSV
jgi:ribosome-binding ATPase YchF (GTP1/OBG family)